MTIVTRSKEALLKESLRKTIHITIVFVPNLAEKNLYLTVTLLCAGIFFYIINETARIIGADYGLISRITAAASRPNEQGFLWGPVTLGLGALIALLYYPSPAATLAIYALAFGDGIASLVGKMWGRQSIPWLRGKTLAGSFACFIAVFASACVFLQKFWPALLTAATATLLELIPLKDFDNLLIPLGTGLVLFVTL